MSQIWGHRHNLVFQPIPHQFQHRNPPYPSAKDCISGYACDLSSPDLEANVHHLSAQCGDKLDHVVFTAGDKLAITKLEDATLASIQKARMVRC